jgi:NAD(P)-dependent dehydrogenase (short-subunit alcohol dehydrogenase family)
MEAAESLNMSTYFQDKVAVITGGSSGIGRATALAFAAEGSRVAVGARRAQEGEETVSLIKKHGGDALFVQTDVRDAAQVRQLIQTALDRWHRLDFAFNNAGIEGSAVAAADYDEKAWDDVIAVNLKGVFLAMKYEIPPMLAHGAGSIVNMSSIAGLVGGSIGIAYFASKHGVIGATKAAALEYARSGIRVNAVCPAVIGTDMANRAFSDMPAIAEMHPMGRIGTPEEIASAVVWLCSDRAAFITGVSLPIDGGWVAR